MPKENILEKLSRWMNALTVIPVLAMLAHITVDVFMRFVFGASPAGTLEIVSYYYMVAVVLMPLAAVELARQSIAVDLFYQMMPPGMQAVALAFVLLASAATYGGMAVISWPDALRALQIREIVMGTIIVPIWPARFLLPASMTLASLVCLMLFFKLLFDKSARHALVEVRHEAVDHEVE